MLSLKKVSPTRMIKNEFYEAVQALEDKGASAEELSKLLGKGRSKKGIFEGDMIEGELEIGQIASHLRDIPSAATVVQEMVSKYNQVVAKLSKETF